MNNDGRRICATVASVVPDGNRARVYMQKSKFQIFFRHLHGDLNLNEIKNALRLLSVNRETNLMNITKL